MGHSEWRRIAEAELNLTLASREQETFEQALRFQAENFRAASGVSVDFQFRPIHDHYTYGITKAGLKSGEFDLFLCCTDWLPEAIAAGLVEPLDLWLSTDPIPDWPEGWHPAMRALIGNAGKVFGIPWHDGPEVFHTRRDLFESPEEKAAFLQNHGRELRIPQTWEEFVEVGKFFTRPEQGLWGCCQGAYTDGHNNVYDFLIQLWSRGGTLLDSKLNPRFHEAAGVEALEFYSDLFHTHRIAPPECLEMGSVECGDFYAAGNAAMSWNWCGFAAVCELPQ